MVPETSSSDAEDEASEADSDGADMDQAGSVVVKARFRFRIHREAVSYTNGSEYKSSVLNWSSKPYFGHRPFDSVGTKTKDPVSIGPCAIAEIQDMVRSAADKAGCSISCHKGARLVGTRVTMRFGCDHGRERYGAEKSDPVQHSVDVETVVVSTVNKRRQLRKNHGYKPTPTQHRRHKCVKCPFGFSINGVASCHTDKDNFKTIPLTWTMANHGLSKASFQHERHPFRGTSTMLNDEERNCYKMRRISL